MRIKQLIASEDEFKDFVWSFIDAENHGWREEDLPRLQPFFDFIVAVNNVALLADDGYFVDVLRSSLGRETTLHVYNLRTEAIRSASQPPS